MSCSSDDQSDKECPLCMEVLEIDDIDFYPCKCEYQICRFCWHRLRNDENGLCPACRQPYPEDPVNFKPLSSADLQRIKDEKKMKQQAEKMRISESRKHLANYRVLQKNLVYVVGLSARFASEEILRKQEFFGRFGKIQKIVLGTTPTSSLPSHLSPSHTAYITYNKVDEALRAIQGVNNSTLDGRCVKASLGTTKYCSSFLRSQSCGKPECMYLHDTADNDISFTKEDMHAGKHSDYERRLIEMMVSKRQALERRQPAQINVKPTTYYDQTGRDVVEDQISEAYPAEPEAIVEQFDLKEQQTHEKENHVTKRPKKSSPVRVRQASPPSAESRSTDSLSSLPDAAPVVEIQPEPEPEPEPEPMPEPMPVEEPKVVLAAPPGLPSSSENTTSRLLRLMNLSEGSGQGSVPAPAPQEEAPAPLTNWQSLLGLAPPVPQPEPVIKTQRLPSPPPGLNPFDDDLGFDPFNESTKGLAKLLEEERVRHPPVSSMFNAHRPSLQDLWAPVTSFGGLGPSRTQQPFGNHTPFDMFGLTSTPQLNGNYSNGGHHPPPSQYNDFPMHQSHHQVHSHSSYAPPPGLAPPGRHAPVSQPQSITEWQEGLKALLPNVNVRFASDLEQQASQRWQSSSSGSFGSLHPSILPHSVPPPPGFSIPNR